MPYASFSDVLVRYPPMNTMIGSDSNEVSTVDVSSIYVAGAEGIVDAYIGAKYQTPVAMPQALVTQVTADIAIYKMCEDKLPRIPDFAEKRYQHAIEILQAINSGQMVLVGSGVLPVIGGNNDAWSNTGSFHNIFSPVLDILEQTPDRDQVRAEEAERFGDF